MPHELIAGLEAGALVLLALLLVPKRRVDHLRSRLWDLGSGRRRCVTAGRRSDETRNSPAAATPAVWQRSHSSKNDGVLTMTTKEMSRPLAEVDPEIYQAIQHEVDKLGERRLQKA